MASSTGKGKAIFRAVARKEGLGNGRGVKAKDHEVEHFEKVPLTTRKIALPLPVLEAIRNQIAISSVLVLGGVVLLFADKWFKNPTIDDEKGITVKKAEQLVSGNVLR